MNDGIHILHVDDDPEFVDLTATYLEQEDDQFTVSTAHSPAEGMELFHDDIDCVLSDFDMPETNGIQFLRTFRTEYPDVPFILYTGKGSEEVASEAISAGVNDYVQKRTGTEQYDLLANRITTAVRQYRAEQELEQQKDLFAKTQDLADVGAWEYDPQEGTAYFSEKVYEIYGVDPTHDPVPEEDIQKFYHPEDQPVVREAVETALESGTDYDIEVRINSADGTEKWVRTCGTPETVGGTVTRVRGTIRDITERKQRERALDQQRTRLAVALEGSKAGVWEWVPDTDEVFWHESTERLFGLDPGTFESTYDAFRDRVHDDDLHILDSALENAQPNHDPFEAEYRITTADDETRWVHARGEYVDIDGLSPRYMGVISDITERKERERDLERTKEWYRSLLDTAPDAVFVADANTGEIRETNQAATRLLGRSREEIVGMHQTELHPGDKAEKYSELFSNHVDSGGGRDETLGEQADIYVIDADGEEIPVEINARAIEIDGEPLNQGYFRDITDRKERERELRRQNERLDEFITVVGHDIGNLLNTLSVSLELLETTDEESLDRCHRSVDRMEQLIDDLMLLARHGESSFEPTEVELGTVVKECAQTTIPSEASFSFSFETDTRIRAEETRLKQLLENLFANAIEHGGSDVSISVGPIDGGFYVEDDGDGIPADKREHCFRIGYSTSDDGTGFGLNIVKQVVAAHGWSIEVTESDDGGARFEITGVDGVK